MGKGGNLDALGLGAAKATPARQADSDHCHAQWPPSLGPGAPLEMPDMWRFNPDGNSFALIDSIQLDAPKLAGHHLYQGVTIAQRIAFNISQAYRACKTAQCSAAKWELHF